MSKARRLIIVAAPFDPAEFETAAAAFAVVFGAPRLLFLARDLLPAPCLSSINHIASSSVIVRLTNSSHSDWFIVCMPYLAWPICICE